METFHVRYVDLEQLKFTEAHLSQKSMNALRDMPERCQVLYCKKDLKMEES
ncbi:hypothetical protein [Halobacillus salinus]|uniref:hypothetical protein n=1 Tax=Halobacillus salinus TaxID=192814 RepID=UPI0015907283|nr:hypothetical protein [Halobacillus salinus]